MKKVNFIKTLSFILICFCCFAAKTSLAQLTPGDIAIVGVNGDTRTTPLTPFQATIAFVALVDIPNGTIIKITDYSYNGTAFGASSSDGLLTWTLSQAVPKGTVFSVSFTNGVAPPVIEPSNYGSVVKSGYTNSGVRPISEISGDSWFIYTTNPDNSINFIYGFLNTDYTNPSIPGNDPTTGWTLPGNIPSNQSSVLPTQLIGTNAYNTMVTYTSGPDLSRHFNYYNATLSGTRDELLNNIRTPANWASTDAQANAKDLSPGTGGGAFPGAQPIYTVIAGATVTNVISSATGTKKVGDVIPIILNFSENVTVNTAGGVPRLKLNSAATAFANYVSTSGSALTFNYTVATGDVSPDLNYSANNSLSLENGTIKSSTNLDAILTLPAIGAPNSLGGSSNIVIDGIVPTITQVSSNTANGSYRVGQSIDITMTFSEPVNVVNAPLLNLNSAGAATYLSGTGTSTLLFRYTIQANQNSADLDYSAVNALNLSGGSIKDIAGNNAIITLPTPGGPGSLGVNANIIIDNVAPTVTSSSSTNGSYAIGSLVPIYLNFSEAINVTGSPTLALNAGLPAGVATYAGGTGTATLTFNYTVAAGQSSADLDYISTTALALNGGTMKDLAGNNLVLTLPAPGSPTSLGSLSNVVINGIRPTILSIVREGGAAALTKAATVKFVVTFSEPVNGVDIDDFDLKAGFPTGSYVSFFSTPNSSTVNITVNTGNADASGTVGIDLIPLGTGIASLANGNQLAGAYTTGQTYTVDRTTPVIPILRITSLGASPTVAKTGEIVRLLIFASEVLDPLTVTMNGHPVVPVLQSSSFYTAEYTVTSTDPEGPVTFTISFSDLIGNVGTQVTATTDASKVIVDNVPTTITTVNSTATNGPHAIGALVPLSVTFSEGVTVTGTPTLSLNTGAGAIASYTGGTSTVLNFQYTVAAGQSASPLDYTSTTALSLNGGTINDANGIPVGLTLPAPGALGSLSNNRSIVINGLTPTVESILRKTPTTALTNVGSVQFAVTFSEPVTNVDPNDFEITTGSLPLAAITSVLGTGTTYTVTVSTGIVNGTLAINLKSSGTGIVNNIGNPIQTGYGPSESYTIDRALPALLAVIIQSNHVGNGSIAKLGDIITLNFLASKTINTPAVTINGNVATVTNPSGNNWRASYTTQATDNNGLVQFTINYSDLAGNVSPPRITTTDGSSVTFDKTAPTLTAVTIASNNVAYPAYAKSGALVTLSFTASKTLQNPVVTIGGVTAPTLSAGGFSWTTMYALPLGLAEGEVPFTINYSDTFGNTGTEQTTVTAGSMVTYDKTTPTLSNVSISSNNPNPALAKPGDRITLTFTASEGIRSPGVSFYGSPSISIVPQGNNVWTGTVILSALNTEGAVPFAIQYSDFAGNAGTAVTATNDASSVTYDKTPPIAPNFLEVTAGDRQNVITWFSNTDFAIYELIGGTTGVLSNNVLTTITAANATNQMTFTQTGLTNFQTYSYALRVTDAAGNTSTSPIATGTPLNGQTITFNPLVAAEYGSSFTLSATSSSGLPVTFTSNEPALATISGNTVTIVGVNNLQSVSIIATQAGNPFYSYATPVTRLLQITPKPVTVTATAQAKVFGSPEPALNVPTINPALVGADASTGTLSRAVGENAGTYEIQQNTFNLDPFKYAINYVPADFTISKQPVTITPQLAYSKTYGQTDPVFAYNFSPLASLGVITGDLARVPGENAGTYNFDLGTLTAGSNYNLTLSPLPQFTINKSAITVTPITANIQYGDTDPVIAYNYTPALQDGDSFTGALVRASGNAPGNYLITQGSLALSSNYILNFSPAPVNFVVQKKNIGITPTAGQGKVYGDVDGTINYTVSPALLDGDTFSGALDRVVGTDVADYQIRLGSLMASNPQNYNLQLNAENYKISLKPIGVIATAVSQLYGDADPVSLPYTLSTPLVNGDSFSGKMGRAPGTAVGNYAINVGNLAISSNYAISFTGADLSITPKPITITALNAAKTYGDTDPEFIYTGSPALISGDVYSGKLGRAAGEDVGNYALALGSLTLTNNYTLILNPGAELVINKKAINVLVDSKSKVYGTADPAFSYTPMPALVNSDVFNGTLTRTPGENKGSYPITTGSLTAGGNYVLSLTAANLTINAAPLLVTADPKSKFVGTENPVFTGQYSGFVNGDDVASLTSPAVYTSIATANSPIGTYPIVPSGATALNYTITPVNGVLTVSAGAPTSVLFAGTTLYENQAAGANAGTLSSTSDDTNANFIYSLVSGAGDADNAAFRISGNQLLTAASLDYENKKVYSVRVRSTTQYGFSLDNTFTINLSDVNEVPTLDAIANKTICYTTANQTIDLTGISAGPETAQNKTVTVTGSNTALLQSLTITPGAGGTAKISYRIKSGASGISNITVTVKDDGGTNNGGVDTYSRTFVLTVNALPVVAISANTGENNNANSTSVSKGETVVLTATGGSTYVWALHNSIISGQNAGVLTVRPRETTTYTVTVSNANGCTEQKSFTVNVLDDMEKIKATNILSPNGDGYNDKWIVENIDFYPNNEVKIFDKSGRMVYSKKGYDNSWDGTLNGTPLTEGTYYYVIDFGKNQRRFKGFITIIREN